MGVLRENKGRNDDGVSTQKLNVRGYKGKEECDVRVGDSRPVPLPRVRIIPDCPCAGTCYLNTTASG